MATLLGQVIPLALASSVNPGMIITGLALLLSPIQPLKRAIAFLAGAAFTSVIIGTIVALSAGSLNPPPHSHQRPIAVSWLFIGAGLLIMAGAGWEAVHPPKPRHKTRSGNNRLQRMVQDSGPIATFLLGAGIMLSNVKALALYLVGVKAIADAQLGAIWNAAFVAGFIIVMLSGLEIPIAIYATNRNRAAAVLTKLRAWIIQNARTLVLVVGAIAGLYLVMRGIAGLVA